MNDRSSAVGLLIRTILLATWLLSLTLGCRSQTPPADIIAWPLAPADFQLQFHVKNHQASPATDPLRQTSQTILQNDRSLRVAIGPGATTDYYPRATRRLEPAEIDRLWQWLQQENLLADPSPDRPPISDDQVIYELKILLKNRTIRHQAVAGDHSALDRLAKELLLLRSGPIPPSPATSQPAEAK